MTSGTRAQDAVGAGATMATGAPGPSAAVGPAVGPWGPPGVSPGAACTLREVRGLHCLRVFPGLVQGWAVLDRGPHPVSGRH